MSEVDQKQEGRRWWIIILAGVLVFLCVGAIAVVGFLFVVGSQFAALSADSPLPVSECYNAYQIDPPASRVIHKEACLLQWDSRTFDLILEIDAADWPALQDGIGIDTLSDSAATTRLSSGITDRMVGELAEAGATTETLQFGRSGWTAIVVDSSQADKVFVYIYVFESF